MQRLVALVLTVACMAAAAVGALDRVAKTQPANLTRTAIVLHADPSLLLAAFAIDGDGSNGERGTIQPGVALWNADSGAMLLDRQINVAPDGEYTTALSSSGHDAPALVQTATGGVLAVYGAASTYLAYHPPASWRCFSNVACEPFKFAASSDANAHVVDTLASSPEYLLPTVGLSETSYATLGNTTIIAGQQQPGGPYGQSAAQAYVTFHATADGGTFDTAAGPWDFKSSHAPPASGTQTLTLTPQDDAYAAFGITSAGAGQGTVALTLAGSPCTITISSNGDASAAAAAIAAAFPRACPSLSNRFAAVQVQFDPVMAIDRKALAPAEVGITTSATSRLSAPTITCSGAISCGTAKGPDTIAVERGSGLHRHFLFGGVLHSGSYVYYLMDVEKLTGSWYGAASNSYALALACFRAREPSGATWTWTDCGGGHAFTMQPGVQPVARLDENSPYLIRAPQGGYRGGMAPYVYDWSMRAQADAGSPVIAAVSAALMRDGNVMLVHGCQTSSRVLTACYALYDTHTGTTRSAGTIDTPAGGSLASIAVVAKSDGTIEAGVLAGEGDRWGCAPGTCFITYRYDAQADRWSRLASAPLGGSNTDGFPGSLAVDGDRFLLQLHRKTAQGYTQVAQVRS
jgi:hypothetical protein